MQLGGQARGLCWGTSVSAEGRITSGRGRQGGAEQVQKKRIGARGVLQSEKVSVLQRGVGYEPSVQ